MKKNTNRLILTFCRIFYYNLLSSLNKNDYTFRQLIKTTFLPVIRFYYVLQLRH